MSTARKAKAMVPAIRCAIYTRKSHEDGLEQEFNSLDAQREAAEAYIASQKAEGWVCLPDRYNDGGFSGGNMDRPALARLLADIDTGEIDCVVVYKVDRLSRSLMDFARIVEVFERQSVSFVSVTQQFNTTHSMGRLTLNILLSFAQFEREIIGERIRDKKAAMARKGMWHGGIPILGYNVDRSNCSPKLVVNAFEAARVREVFRLYLELKSLGLVVAELDKRGWCNKAWKTKAGKPKGGKPFDKCGLYNLLTNPLLMGKIRHKGDIYEGEHEGIITDETFQKVRRTLQSNGRGGSPDVRNKHGALLRGLLRCKACGKAMLHTFTCKRDKRYRYYTCTTVLKRGSSRCPAGSLPAAEIESVVVEQIRCIGQDAGLRAEVLEQTRASIDSQLGELQVQHRQVTRELNRHAAELQRLATDGKDDRATTGRIADLNEKVDALGRRGTELRDGIAALRRQRLDDQELAAMLGDFDGLWSALSPREQAQVLAALIARVEYDAEESTISVTFKDTGIEALSEKVQIAEAEEEAA